MSKQVFVQSVEKFFVANAATIAPEAKLYFEQTFKTKRVNPKDAAKADALKSAIVEVVRASKVALNRNEIADTINNEAMVAEEFILNIKGDVAYGSVTAFANQLVEAGTLTKSTVKNGKSKSTVYSVVQ